jgi:transcriptional regulator with XRE-family HTH domain
METIGEKIRIRRLIRNYSQEYMAFMLEISQAAYSNLERNETELTIKRVYEIAEILEMSPFELMPKPKFGNGINHLVFWKTIRKFKDLWVRRIRAKKQFASSPNWLPQ